LLLLPVALFRKYLGGVFDIPLGGSRSDAEKEGRSRRWPRDVGYGRRMCSRSRQVGSASRGDERRTPFREGDKRYRRRHLAVLAVRGRGRDPRLEGQSTHRMYGGLVRSRERVHETRSYCKKPPRFGQIDGQELSASRLSEVLPERFQGRKKCG